MLESEQRKARLNSLAIVVALPTLLIGWLFGLRTLERWRVRLTESNRRLDQQAHELVELNANLDKRVLQRTTQLEEAHLAELKQKEILQRIFDYIPVMTFLSDATGKVKMVNREFEHVLGWSLEEFPNTSHLFKWCADGDSCARVSSHMQNASGEWLDFRVFTRAGVALDTSWASIRLSDGSIIGIGQNISDRKRTEAELANAKDVAEAANLAKSEFLAHMSHEIRTPMNAIIGMAELLSETGLTPEQEEYVRIFRRAGDNLLNIINDILDLSKVEAGLLELGHDEFDLNEVVERTAEFLAQRAHQNNLDLTCYIKPDVPLFLIGDAPRLRQILINLLGNAIKFTEAGEIVLRVENDPESAAPGALLFAVSDTGIGIAPDKLDDIFESFKQADSTITRRFEGTGLGLSISKRLVELMGGKIWVESQVGHGSTFYFTACFELQAQQKPRATVPVDLIGLKALVIDDNATNRFILNETLASWGFSVATAESGAVGLAELKRAIDSGKPYQLLLLDCRMPGMDGFQVAQGIRKLGVDVTTIMLTSDNRSLDIARSRDLGLRGYLVKPVKRNDLLEAVINALGRSQLPAAETKRPRQAAPVGSERSGHILLAEDNEDNRTLILAYLKNSPHQIDLAENGLIALEKFKTEGRYDLVLMDMQMPLMDGYTATREIRKWEAQQRAKPTPIVALTAYALKEEAEKCIEAGCNSHVSKPVKKVKLLETVEQYLHEGVGAL
jgi:PAS domain S-box-containing protein